MSITQDVTLLKLDYRREFGHFSSLVHLRNGQVVGCFGRADCCCAEVLEGHGCLNKDKKGRVSVSVLREKT